MRYISTFADTNLSVGVVSDLGQQRNEGDRGGSHRYLHFADDFAAFELYDDGQHGAAAQIALVASAVGRSTHLAAAAELVVTMIYNSLQSQKKVAGSSAFPQLLERAIEEAHQRLSEALVAEQVTDEVGVAVAVVAVVQESLYLAYVGDAPVYLVRRGAAHLLTPPTNTAYHSGLGGTPTLGQAAPLLGQDRAPLVQTTIAALGQSASTATMIDQQTSAAHQTQLQLESEDAIVLCSPGMNALVRTPAIADAVSTQTAQEAAWDLADQAKRAGATQSHTVLILQRGRRRQRVDPLPVQGQGRRSRRKILLAALCLILLILSWPFVVTSLGQLPKLAAAVTSGVMVWAQNGEPERAADASAIEDAAASAALTENAVNRTSGVSVRGTTADVAAKSTGALADDRTLSAGDGRAAADSSVESAALADQQTMAMAPSTVRITARTGLRTLRNEVTAAAPELAPIVMLVDQLSHRYTWDELLQAVQASAATVSVAAEGAAERVALSQTPPTPTPTLPPPTPTALPPTPVPPTPVPPTPAPATVARTPRPAQPTASPTATAVKVDFATAAVTILAPQGGDTLADKRPFAWKANFALPPGYAFEVLFWQRGQDPLTQGKGYAGSTTGTQLNAEARHFRLRNAPDGEYHWGVILIKTEPYQRIKFLGGDLVIYVRN